MLLETINATRKADASKSFSKEVLQTMDHLGYGLEQVKYRREAHRLKDANINKRMEGYSQITSGSKGEGLTCYYENDHDIMFVDRHNVCVLPEASVRSYPDGITVYLLNNKLCHPGYFRLALLKKGTFRDESTEAMLCSNKEKDVYVSRMAYRNKLTGLFLKDSDRQVQTGQDAGPAIPAMRGLYSEDRVWAFRCADQRKLLAGWINRHRKYDWPSKELIETVVSREAQIVPVGCKESQFKDLEWRVCFVTGEQALTDSLNEVQHKLYVLLQMINKDILKPLSDSLSSYLMKNVIFWIAESNHSSLFVNENINDLLKKSLEFLLGTITEGNLPYYMIPERNLLTGRLPDTEQKALIRKLESLLQTDPSTYLLQCVKLRDAMEAMTPEELQTYGKKRNTIERFRLHLMNVRSGFFTKDVMSLEDLERKSWSSREFRKTYFDIADIVFPEWRQYLNDDTDRINKIPLTEREHALFLEDVTKHKSAERTADFFLDDPEICRHEIGFEPSGNKRDILIKVTIITVVKTEVLLS